MRLMYDVKIYKLLKVLVNRKEVFLLRVEKKKIKTNSKQIKFSVLIRVVQTRSNRTSRIT